MTLTNSKTNKIISKIKCNFINGKLGGEASGTNVKLSLIGDLSTIKKNTFKGKFDEEGFPTGDWILSSNSRLWKEIYNGNDTCIVTYINLSTGDKINTSSAPVLPNIIIKEVNSLLKTLLMRDSEQQFLTEFQFDSPRIVQVYSDGKYSYSVTTDNPSSSLFIITYPHHYPSLISPESGTEMPVFQDIPEDALRPSKKPKTSTD